MAGECKEEHIHFYLFIKSFQYPREPRLVLLLSVKLHLLMDLSSSSFYPTWWGLTGNIPCQSVSIAQHKKEKLCSEVGK